MWHYRIPGWNNDAAEQTMINCSAWDCQSPTGGYYSLGNCGGGQISAASKFLYCDGVPEEYCLPYDDTNTTTCSQPCSDWGVDTGQKITGYHGLSQPSLGWIKDNIQNRGPVVAAMKVCEDFKSYKSGIYSHVSGSCNALHAIAVIGFDDAEQAFLCKNSWGTGWGNGWADKPNFGYFKIAYSQMNNVVDFAYEAYSYPDATNILPLHKIDGAVIGCYGPPFSGLEVTAKKGTLDVQKSWADGSGHYRIARPGGTYTLAPSRPAGDYTFDPATISATVSDADLAGRDFVAWGAYALSGVVTLNGASLDGVTVEGFGPTEADRPVMIDHYPHVTGQPALGDATGVSGQFKFKCGNGTYTLTPSFVTPAGSNYTFRSWKGNNLNPGEGETVLIDGASRPGRNFAVRTFEASGEITLSGAGLANIPVQILDSFGVSQTATTGGTGHYSRSGLPNDRYQIRPSKAGYAFAPNTATVTVADAAVTQNFTASLLPIYTLSGSVGGDIAGGVAITLSGAANATKTTDASGNYSFASLTNGSYTLTPSKAGYVFTPVSAAVTIDGANGTVPPFTAHEVHALSGTVRGEVQLGVTIILSGAANATMTTGDSGNYSFANLTSGTYTVTACMPGFSFTPPSWNVTISGADATGRDFTSRAPAPGDCDSSGGVTIGEVQGAINMFLGTAPLSCGVDGNGNNAVSIGEVQRVINAFLGVCAPSSSALPPSPAAPMLALGSVTTGVGSLVAVPVTLATNGAPVCSAASYISYDASRLLFQGAYIAASGPAAVAGKSVSSNASGGVVTLGVHGGNQTLIAGGGTIAYLHFTILPGATGTIPLSGTCGYADANGNDYGAACQGGTVTVTYTISGHIGIAGYDHGLPGAVVTLSPGGTTTTDNWGNYSFSGLSARNYAVTPSKTGFAISPSSPSVSVPPDKAQDFSATANSTYQVGGTVYDKANQPFEGVRAYVEGWALEDYTGPDGKYQFTLPGKLNYRLRASKQCTVFSPAYTDLASLSANSLVNNFYDVTSGNICTGCYTAYFQQVNDCRNQHFGESCFAEALAGLRICFEWQTAEEAAPHLQRYASLDHAVARRRPAGLRIAELHGRGRRRLLRQRDQRGHGGQRHDGRLGNNRHRRGRSDLRAERLQQERGQGGRGGPPGAGDLHLDDGASEHPRVLPHDRHQQREPRWSPRASIGESYQGGGATAPPPTSL